MDRNLEQYFKKSDKHIILKIGNITTDIPVLSIDLIIMSYNWLAIWKEHFHPQLYQIPN